MAGCFLLALGLSGFAFPTILAKPVAFTLIISDLLYAISYDGGIGGWVFIPHEGGEDPPILVLLPPFMVIAVASLLGGLRRVR